MAVRKKDVAQLHIMHYSSEFPDSTEKTVEDLRFCFSKEPLIVTFTEMGNYGTQVPSHNAMRRIARDEGYRPIIGPGDTQIAVNTSIKGIGVKDQGSIPVHGGTSNYRRKYVNWARVNFYGDDVYIHVAHWVTTPTSSGIDMVNHRKMSRAVAQAVVFHARGKRMSFFAGDMNVNPSQDKYPHQIFNSNHLQSCWRDADRRPPTRTSTIDVIGRYKKDNRVSFAALKAWPYQHSDHRPFSVWYDIKLGKNNTYGGNTATTPSAQASNPNMFATGGDVSFADYRDKEIYALPFAVDHEDTSNG